MAALEDLSAPSYGEVPCEGSGGLVETPRPLLSGGGVISLPDKGDLGGVEAGYPPCVPNHPLDLSLDEICFFADRKCVFVLRVTLGVLPPRLAFNVNLAFDAWKCACQERTR